MRIRLLTVICLAVTAAAHLRRPRKPSKPLGSLLKLHGVLPTFRAPIPAMTCRACPWNVPRSSARAAS